jgi:hypothetical protein
MAWAHGSHDGSGCGKLGHELLDPAEEDQVAVIAVIDGSRVRKPSLLGLRHCHGVVAVLVRRARSRAPARCPRVDSPRLVLPRHRPRWRGHSVPNWLDEAPPEPFAHAPTPQELGVAGCHRLGELIDHGAGERLAGREPHHGSRKPRRDARRGQAVAVAGGIPRLASGSSIGPRQETSPPRMVRCGRAYAQAGT